MFLSEERPIFVVGSQRSGTTLLRYMLCAHPRIYIPPESNFIPRFINQKSGEPLPPAQAVQVLKEIQGYRTFFKDWQGPPPDPSAYIEKLPDLRLSTLLTGLYSGYASQNGAVRWGDKTPMYVTHIDDLAGLFPEAQFIHIYRDGRDVALSMLKAYRDSRFFYVDIYYAARVWKRRLRKAFADGARLGSRRYLDVRYEDLVTNPEMHLRRICDYLGEEYFPGMADPHEEASHHYHSQGIHTQTREPPDPARMGRWRGEMSTADQRLFQKVSGELLAQLGYDAVWLGGMSVPETLRFLKLMTKFSLVETGQNAVRVAGIFHPTAVLAGAKKRRKAASIP